MSAGRQDGPEDDGRVRHRRWVAPEQPASPEGRAVDEVAADGGRQPQLHRESGPPDTEDQPSRAPGDHHDDRGSDRDCEPAPVPDRAPPKPDQISRRAAAAALRASAHSFPKDPASPVPRTRYLRRPHPPRPTVTAIWQRNEEESRRFATRFAGQLLVIGASLGAFLTLVLGVPQGVFSAGWFSFLGASVVAASWGLFYILLPTPAPDLVLRATPAASALLIAVTLALNHSNAADGMLLLTWPLLFAAYLLPRPTAYWTLAVVVGCLTVVLLAGTGPDRFSAWVEISTSMALTLVVILRVRDQADRLKQALAEQASTDPLTGLSNRRAFDDALEREVTRQRRTREPLSLLAVDVDHFKKINDTWGHAAGDDTLAALGDLLPRLVRASDTVSRVGGEEFGVLLPDCPPAQARARADALRAEVYNASRTWKHPVTVSVGVATLPDSADALNDLVVAADMALYAAKASGRDQVRVAPTRSRGEDVP